MDREKLRAIIEQAVIKSIITYSTKKLKEKEMKFQILDLLMPKERRIRSIVGGLESSMGKTLWEPLAKEIAKNNEFEIVTENLTAPVNMPGILSNTLSEIIESRLNNIGLYNSISSHARIKQVCQPYLINPITQFGKAPRGFGVDIWLKKDGVNYLFDTKTVQPYVGSYSKFLSQLLNWYIYFYSKYPVGYAEARIVFPYNPHNGDFWKNTQARGKPLEPHLDAWVEDEFWDFVSGIQGTFELIKECFVEIFNTGRLEQELGVLFDRYKDKIVPSA